MQNPTFTFDVEVEKGDAIAKALMGASFQFTPTADSIWHARKKATTATFYRTGKLVVQGTLAPKLVSWLVKKNLLPSANLAPQDQRIGTDEAGKGDYFGPLVTAAVLVTPKTERELVLSGVRDSKTLSDGTATRLALLIRSACPNSIVAIGPKKYNELQGKLGTVNKVLGWAHARAIENVLQKHNCSLAVADQFGDERYIKRALMQRGKEIELFQMPHGEQDVAVAAASVLARAEFLTSLQRIRLKFSMEFPKGASREVIQAARLFVDKFGADKLKDIAKLHFRTTEEVIGPSRLSF